MDPATIHRKTGPPGHGTPRAQRLRELHSRTKPNAKSPGRRPRPETKTNANGLQSHQHPTSTPLINYLVQRENAVREVPATTGQD